MKFRLFYENNKNKLKSTGVGFKKEEEKSYEKGDQIAIDRGKDSESGFSDALTTGSIKEEV